MRTTIVDRSELGRAATWYTLQGKAARASFGCEIKHTARLGGARWGQWVVLRWHAGNRLGNYRFSHARTSNAAPLFACTGDRQEPLGPTAWRRHGSAGSLGSHGGRCQLQHQHHLVRLSRNFLGSLHHARGAARVTWAAMAEELRENPRRLQRQEKTIMKTDSRRGVRKGAHPVFDSS